MNTTHKHQTDRDRTKERSAATFRSCTVANRALRGRRAFMGTRGFTLVELLVVIGVLSVLAGIALPIFRNTIKDQKTTQAARQVVTYIEAARSRAIASKGRVGVLIRRQGDLNAMERSYSTQMQLSVAYPPYSGESDNARALLIHDDGNPPSGLAGLANAALFDPADNTLLLKAVSDFIAGRSGPIRQGDPIQFGESGRTVAIQSMSLVSGATGAWAAYNGWVKLNFDPRGVIPIPGAAIDTYGFPESSMMVGSSGSREITYKIFRDPVASSASSLDTLRGMAIDLNYSGIGRGGVDFNPMIIHPSRWSINDPGDRVDFQSVLLMFGPDGRLEFCSSGFAVGSDVVQVDYRPSGLIYFCLGRSDGVFADAAGLFSNTNRDRANIMDPESTWIVVNPFNGNVFAAPSTAPEATVATFDGSGLTVPEQLSLAVQQSRQLAFEGDELTSL